MCLFQHQKLKCSPNISDLLDGSYILRCYHYCMSLQVFVFEAGVDVPPNSPNMFLFSIFLSTYMRGQFSPVEIKVWLRLKLTLLCKAPWSPAGPWSLEARMVPTSPQFYRSRFGSEWTSTHGSHLKTGIKSKKQQWRTHLNCFSRKPITKNNDKACVCSGTECHVFNSILFI